MTTQQRFSKRQGGLVLILVVVGMTSLIAMAGLALDFGLAFLTKTRIQNALDAAALSGAKALKTTGSTVTATSDAQSAFNYYLGQLPRPGNTNPVPTIQFSNALVPFTAGASGAPGSSSAPNFIRVRMPANYTIPTYLIGVLPSVGRTLTLNGSAVAGPVKLNPIGEICNLTPIVVYATTTDTNCSDGACYGYTVGQTYKLKDGKNSPTAGPGNFNLLDLGCSSGGGAACVRENLAGGGGCATAGDRVTTKPGNNFGPFEQGINTRFNDYKGGSVNSADYPPDVITATGINYATYKTRAATNNYDVAPPTGVPLRRVIAVVLSDFSETTKGGKTTIPVTSIGCFFLTDKTQDKGVNENIPAEFTLDCKPEGGTLSDSSLTSVDKLFKIVLYKDPDSNDS